MPAVAISRGTETETTPACWTDGARTCVTDTFDPAAAEETTLDAPLVPDDGVGAAGVAATNGSVSGGATVWVGSEIDGGGGGGGGGGTNGLLMVSVPLV